ncbi:sugar porter family MFS transporter [Persicitalea jodogahamensis]|uniref:MFS transporter n=1 Tax=Persicitalea jodogahamensis TaxID=402147 RepID=A0A8J3DCI2_9BACT|nr:sugar porter family MFS transporter [Persicitalea jodogahamensis]GHB83637.1 MFS transporter [Persicitalea jodogahamensis]
MKNSQKVFIWSLSAALGGFLFGFDTAVISGAEQTLQKLWNSSAFEHGLTVSIALIGTVFGALFGGVPADRYGRRKSLFIVAILYLVSAIGSALAPGWFVFLVFRLVGGVGVGISSVVAPMYISEIAPPSRRGRLVALFQFNIVLGILISYLSNYALEGIGENAWRWMLGVEAIPALLFMGTLFLIPESPRWLILKRGKIEEARTILATSDAGDADRVVTAIIDSHHQSTGSSFRDLFKPEYKRPVTLAVMFALFNQLAGINAIIYYAPRVFEMAGLGKESALLSSAGIGLVNLLATLAGLLLIDRFGRRFLMQIGSFGLIASLSLVSYFFFTDTLGGMQVPFFLFVYIAFFAMSQGAVIWVFISEIFPNDVRAYGQSLGSFTHWIAAAVISFIFPYLAQTFGGGTTFAFFAGMMVLQLLFVLKLMPETKGTSLEKIEESVVVAVA